MRTSWMLGIASALLIVGCSEDHTPLGPEVKGSALAGSSPKSPNAKQFSVSGGKVSFAMEAAQEKINGRVTRGVSGTLFVDAKDLTQTTGNIVVDLEGLEIYRKERQEDGTFKEEARDDTQNLHAKQWFEIDQSTPTPIRDRNRRVEFRISSVESATEKDVSKLSGETRTVTLKAKGELLLHQRQSSKNVDLEVTFTFEGDNATSIKLKTAAPFGVKLAEHDVRPRSGFGKLAKEGLETMGSKVAKEALVEIDVNLVLGDQAAATAAASAAAPAPEASASAPTPDDSASADASASADMSASASTASAGPSASSAPSAAPTASASAKPKQN